MASYDTGYEDELFQHPVGHTLHCSICTNVLKDPVMCGQNEHLFCRACITTHLMNFQTCPTCMEPLTVDTLCRASRGIRNLLAELQIRCEFFDRGCGRFIELGNLNGHVAECGFAPAVCSNEGCQLEVNKQDLLHHQTTVCEQRRVKCHSCSDIRREMDAVKIKLAAMNVKLDRNKTDLGNVCARIPQVQEQLTKQEESNCRLEACNVGMNYNLCEMAEQLQRTTQTLDNVQAEQQEMKRAIAVANKPDREPMLVIAGGWNRRGDLVSVEMFSVSSRTWTPLQPMKECRLAASSVVYNNQIILMGGFFNSSGNKSMEKLSTNAIHVDQSITWEEFAAELPVQLYGHRSVVYNGRLIVIGGVDGGQRAYSNSITEISLVPPYITKALATMPQPRHRHGVVLLDDKIVILGGRAERYNATNHQTVVLYDIAQNECQELPALPYPVSEMATVKWGDDNVIIMGGVDSNDRPLNTALIYNVQTQKSFVLPDMKHKRRGCVAAVVGDTLIVMGGHDDKSVENFKFDRFTWEELPEMHEERWEAAAVVC